VDPITNTCLTLKRLREKLIWLFIVLCFRLKVLAAVPREQTTTGERIFLEELYLHAHRICLGLQCECRVRVIPMHKSIISLVIHKVV
jgi:hypothetical protein